MRNSRQKIRLTVLIVLIVIIFIGHQNCSPTKFARDTGSTIAVPTTASGFIGTSSTVPAPTTTIATATSTTNSPPPPGPPMTFFSGGNNNLNAGYNLNPPVFVNFPTNTFVILVAGFNSISGSIQVSDASGVPWNQITTGVPNNGLGFLNGIFYKKLTQSVAAGGINVDCIACSPISGSASGGVTAIPVGNVNALEFADYSIYPDNGATQDSFISMGSLTTNSTFYIGGSVSGGGPNPSFRFTADSTNLGSGGGTNVNINDPAKEIHSGGLYNGQLGKKPGITLTYSSANNTPRMVFLFTLK